MRRCGLAILDHIRHGEDELYMQMGIAGTLGGTRVPVDLPRGSRVSVDLLLKVRASFSPFATLHTHAHCYLSVKVVLVLRTQVHTLI